MLTHTKKLAGASLPQPPAGAAPCTRIIILALRPLLGATPLGPRRTAYIGINVIKRYLYKNCLLKDTKVKDVV
jgi:hypothetical protein